MRVNDVTATPYPIESCVVPICWKWERNAGLDGCSPPLSTSNHQPPPCRSPLIPCYGKARHSDAMVCGGVSLPRPPLRQKAAEVAKPERQHVASTPSPTPNTPSRPPPTPSILRAPKHLPKTHTHARTQRSPHHRKDSSISPPAEERRRRGRPECVQHHNHLLPSWRTFR